MIVDARPLGTVVVTPPWNFPFAIPCGGVLAALAAGNTVILKPAPESVRIGWWLVRQLWQAGIPRRRPAVRRLLRRRSRTPTDRRPAHLRRHPHRGLRNRQQIPQLAPRPAPVRRDQRQERPRGHRHGRPRTGRQRSGPFGLRPLRSEMFGRQPRNPRARSVPRIGCSCASSVTPPQASPSASHSTTPPAWSRPSSSRTQRTACERALTTLDEGEEWLLEPQSLAR